MFEYYETETNTFFPKPPTPCQGASSITEMMDHHTERNKERPNGVAGGLSLRKGVFLHENLSSARKKQSSSLNPFIEGFPIKQYPPHYIDKYARKIFPLLFGLFNIIYWSYYLPRRWRHIRNDDVDDDDDVIVEPELTAEQRRRHRRDGRTRKHCSKIKAVIRAVR